MINATVIFQALHMLIAYGIMYHVVIKYALRSIQHDRILEESLKQSLDASKKRVDEVRDQSNNEYAVLHNQLVENIPHARTRMQASMPTSGIAGVEISEDRLDELARQLSNDLEKQVL